VPAAFAVTATGLVISATPRSTTSRVIQVKTIRR
jgi:hypothetical protein